MHLKITSIGKQTTSLLSKGVHIHVAESSELKNLNTNAFNKNARKHLLFKQNGSL